MSFPEWGVLGGGWGSGLWSEPNGSLGFHCTCVFVCVFSVCLFVISYLPHFSFTTKLQLVESDGDPPTLVSLTASPPPSGGAVACSVHASDRPTNRPLSFSLSWFQDWHFVRRRGREGRGSSEEASFSASIGQSTPLPAHPGRGGGGGSGGGWVTFSFIDSSGNKKIFVLQV